MAEAVRFLFDANAFVDVGERYYPRDVFRGVWTVIMGELSGERIITIRGVVDELGRVEQPWRVDVIRVAREHLADESEEAVQLTFKRFSQNVADGGGLSRSLSETDLFVLSVGEVLSMPIVTRDGEIKNACDRSIVKTRALVPIDYFRELGWTCDCIVETS